MKAHFKKILISSISALGVLILYVALSKEEKGFSLKAIQGTHPIQQEFLLPALAKEEEEEVEEALSQSYTYFGAGGQAFAFLSRDERYVLKFFKQAPFRTPRWIYLLPSWAFPRYRIKKIWKRGDKWLRDYSSYALAFHPFKEISALLYAHLKPSSHLQKKLHLIDQKGKSHLIDLDKVDFILQRKAIRVEPAICDWMERGEIEKAKEAISSLIHLLLMRCKRGLHDGDPNIQTNCGFLGTRAIKIDVGRFSSGLPFSSNELHQELLRIFSPFILWLRVRYPLLCDYLEKELAPYVYQKNFCSL
jgi:hypothetical protein